MGLLDKLKSLFGSEQSGQSPTRGNDADVTVEHEPAAGSEHAVKGTDTSRESGTATGTEPEATTGTPEEASEGARVADGDEAAAEAAVTDDGASAADGPVEDEQTDESPSVEEIKGIGPTYAERLEAAGIETIVDLAAVDPAEVAEAAQTGETRAGDWVERARDF